MTPDQPSWLYGTEPRRQVVALGFALVLSAVALDYLMSGHLSLFFDLCFITLCLYLAIRVEQSALSLGAMLPPALMLAVLVLLGLAAPQVVARADDAVVQAVVTGLTNHSVALVAGWALALIALEGRRRGVLSSDDR
ncbi:DUF6542 domain-containing protein [Nocardioides daphniae]|uniref:DUF6542 domain-containing protein n=1 Tax=Nocardioides daphniae TaxID=402297 RepID=A0A4P7U988_9ACTN|nr:DUF6542 domain-containing protein [Nocardioides daphniae]QCC76630.1 hypothetical protein E2C04_04335 [Nocardioides daphniae]